MEQKMLEELEGLLADIQNYDKVFGSDKETAI